MGAGQSLISKPLGILSQTVGLECLHNMLTAELVPLARYSALLVIGFTVAYGTQVQGINYRGWPAV